MSNYCSDNENPDSGKKESGFELERLFAKLKNSWRRLISRFLPLTQLRVPDADVLITPDLSRIDSTSLKDAQESIELGRAECEKMLPKIREVYEKAKK